jgi:hypothetical protein
MALGFVMAESEKPKAPFYSKMQNSKNADRKGGSRTKLRTAVLETPAVNCKTL